MSRYIDADALIEACEQWKETVEHDAQDVAWNHGIDACINEIKHHAPTVNAVEVVRCKDCRYWLDDGIMTTCDKNIGNGYDAEYYCADGKRKEQEHECAD